jgi:biotin operon repressor
MAQTCLPLTIGEANPNSKLTEELVRQILAVLAKPDPPSQEEIGRQFDVSQMTISLLRQGKTWQHIERPETVHRRRPARGSAHGNSKLTESDVRVIKMLLARSYPPSQESIGKAYGVPQTTISAIKRGITWRHVPTPSWAPRS